MKKINFSILCTFFAILFITSCSKKDNETLSAEDEKAIVQAIFNVGADGMAKSRANQYTAKSISKNQLGNYPISNNFEFDYPDGYGGNIHVTVNTGGYTSFDDNTSECLGAFIILNVDEKINHFRVPLSNGREVYVDAYPVGITFTGNFYLLPQCLEFDSAKSFFRIEGTYNVNGIEYDMQLVGGVINADGTCKSISGFINGIAVDFEF